jgi:hypothetical protein
MAARQTVFNSYLLKIARVLCEEFSGKDRRNQSGKRLKVRTWDLSLNTEHCLRNTTEKSVRFYQKAQRVSSFKRVRRASFLGPQGIAEKDLSPSANQF